MVKPKEDPCETCLRWPECNGVDEDCPPAGCEIGGHGRWVIGKSDSWNGCCISSRLPWQDAGSGSPGRMRTEGTLMEPYEIVMLIVLLALEIPAATFLVVAWVRACREARERKDNANS